MSLEGGSDEQYTGWRGSNAPAGAIARIEPTGKHQRMVNTAEPAWASLKINHARQLVNRDETAESWFPDGTRVLTTSTINDDALDDLSVAEEAELVEAFEPDAHVGGDVSVYPDYLPDRRAELIEESMKNALWLEGEIEADTLILPLIKGITQSERELCYLALKYFDHNYAAVYATRYFTAGEGCNIYDLIDGVSEIDRECSANIVLLGVLSPILQKMPDCVTAAAGFNGWHKRISLSDSEQRIRREWDEIEAGVSDWLD